MCIARYYFILLFAGLISGVLSSLFGMGGGLTIVPALLIVLPFFNISNVIIMHIAIGTSFAIMFVNSLNSVRSHHFSGNIEWGIFTKIIIYIALGTVIGTLIANLLSTSWLILLFILILLVVMLRFIKHLTAKGSTNIDQTVNKVRSKLPPFRARAGYGFLTGILAACIGGGSSLIIVPFLKQSGLQIKRAAALAGAFNVFISLVATISYGFLGSYAVGLPKHSTGFIFWPAFLWVLVGSFVGVPIGTRLANKLSERTASILYFLLLLIIFVIMLTKYLISL